jgi:hypothetical protein
MTTELVYAGEFKNFYPLPLSEEAQDCVEGVTILIDRRFDRRRMATVLEIEDTSEGRYVRFQEVV